VIRERTMMGAILPPELIAGARLLRNEMPLA
jgi:hypothetical protein